MDFRMLVLDLDGTVLSRQGTLDPIDVAAALALQRAGIEVTIATGRLFTGTQWVARALGVRGSIAVMNGSELIDAETGEVRRGHYVDRPHRQTMAEVFAEEGLSTLIVFGSRAIHVGQHDAQHAPYLTTWTEDVNVHRDLKDSAAWRAGTDIVAVGTLGEHRAVASAQARLRDALPEPLDSVTFQTHAGSTFLKLRHAEEDKGTALARLAAERGLTAEATVAVGDWLNDLPMLRRAGLGLALGGSDQRVVAAADDVVGTQRYAPGAVAEVARRVWGVVA